MGIAASLSSKATAAGNFEPDVLLANICKHHVTRFPYEIARLAQDLAGGVVVTMPSDDDFQSDEIGPVLKKYLLAAPGVTHEDRRRILRLIENMTMGRNQGSKRVRTSQLSRLISRPVSTRFSSFLDE